jgi:alpha-amylase/alpha-mannosidase (GH57 family)
MVDTAILLHANLLYAEIPFSKIPDVVNRSYLPVLRMLKENPSFRVILNWTGFTLDVLNGEYPEHGKYPEVIDLIKTLVDRGQVELTGTSWAHAVLPICTLSDVKRDLSLYRDTAQRILGVRPTGFFPPELGIDPLLPPVLTELGYDWCFADHDAIRYTTLDALNTANDFKRPPESFLKKTARVADQNPIAQLMFLREMNNLMRSLTDLSPFVWEGAGGASMTAFRSFQAWNSYTLSCVARMAVMNEKKLYRMLDKVTPHLTGYFLPFSTDFEFYGFGGNVTADPVPVSRLENLLRYIDGSPHLTFTLPSAHMERLDEEKLDRHYLRAASWSSDGDFGLWDKDPDNVRLNNFVAEVRDLYFRVGHKLSKDGRMAVEKALLLAMNSDGRGWTPIPEHRLFCFNEALSAFKLLERL